jgi:hypothetical protein
VIEHLDRKEDHDRDKSQDRQTGNQQAQSSLAPLRAPWSARSFRKQILTMAGILQDIRGIEWAPSRRCALDPLLTLALLFGLCQLRGFLNLALQFFHLATQFFLLFRELVLFRRYRRIVKSSTSHHSTISTMHEVENQQRTQPKN